MENNNLKEQVRKDVKEKIAVSNIRKEFDMKSKNNKKLIYWVSSICAVFVLCFSLLISIDFLNNDSNTEIAKNNGTEDLYGKKENLDIKLNINKIKEPLMASLDADEKIIDIEKLPEKFDFIKNTNIPDQYKLESSYNVYTRKDINVEEYDVLHDYVFKYRKDSINKIVIAFSEIDKPLRDYFIDSSDKVSMIGDIEFIISKYKEMYMVTFSYENINFDIETVGITEDELVNLLQSIITEINKSGKENKIVEDKDIGANEHVNEVLNNNYTDYYAGKYIDNNGNNVVLLCEDNAANRKQICSILGITESKTKFKKATYSYEYLTKLQDKISKAMQNKELIFVVSSALMEDTNKIKVTVINNSNENIDKLKALDPKGGAIEIEYNEKGMATQDLLVNAE